eukprot:2712050-Pleurochrysis_carterae.AAC.1
MARVSRRKKRAGVRTVLIIPECVIALRRCSRDFLDRGMLMLAAARSGDGGARDRMRHRPSCYGFTAFDAANARVYAGAVSDAVSPVQVDPARANRKEQGPVQNPEHLGL